MFHLAILGSLWLESNRFATGGPSNSQAQQRKEA
jgi:hypothetical protein